MTPTPHPRLALNSHGHYSFDGRPLGVLSWGHPVLVAILGPHFARQKAHSEAYRNGAPPPHRIDLARLNAACTVAESTTKNPSVDDGSSSQRRGGPVRPVFRDWRTRARA